MAPVNIMPIHEEWKDIPNYEGYYQVSSFGRVKSLKRQVSRYNSLDKPITVEEKILKSSISKGYLVVGLTNGLIKKTIKVHRLVMLAFVGPSELTVNHKDGNKTNNHIENLEYCTSGDNTRHAVRTGLNKPGENRQKQFLPDSTVLEIRKLYDHGNMKQVDICKKFNIHHGPLSLIVRRKTYKWLP